MAKVHLPLPFFSVGMKTSPKQQNLTSGPPYFLREIILWFLSSIQFLRVNVIKSQMKTVSHSPGEALPNIPCSMPAPIYLEDQRPVMNCGTMCVDWITCAREKKWILQRLVALAIRVVECKRFTLPDM